MSTEPTPDYYYRTINGQKTDLYALARVWELTDPALFQALKKILCAGKRGAKSKVQDIQEARDALNRWLEMQTSSEKAFIREYWVDGASPLRSLPEGGVEMLCEVNDAQKWVRQVYWPSIVDERVFKPVSEAEARKLVEYAGGTW